MQIWLLVCCVCNFTVDHNIMTVWFEELIIHTFSKCVEPYTQKQKYAILLFCDFCYFDFISVGINCMHAGKVFHSLWISVTHVPHPLHYKISYMFRVGYLQQKVKPPFYFILYYATVTIHSNLPYFLTVALYKAAYIWTSKFFVVWHCCWVSSS
jgi:hypothetical protein